MPEYLAPAVYVEEVDTGSKPIEGVSTSTSGFIGVTERGPVDVPILVTSTGEYRRWFGEGLDPQSYQTPTDKALHYLPHAVEGFFTNGGKRLYVTRVLERKSAAPAQLTIVAKPDASAAEVQLLVGAPPGAGTVVVADNTGFVPPTRVQIGTGVAAELVEVQSPTAAAPVLTLRLPLSAGHAGGQNVAQVATTPGASDQLAADTPAGASVIKLKSVVTVAAGKLLAIDTGGREELVCAAAPNAGTSITLRTPLQLAHPANATVEVQGVTDTALPSIDPGTPASPGDVVVQLAAAATLAPGDMVHLGLPPTDEFRRVGKLGRATLARKAYADYAVGSLVESLGAPPAALGGTPIALTDTAAEGSTTVRVDRRDGMNVGDVIAVGLGAEREYVQIVALPAELPAPNPGAVVLAAALCLKHEAAPGVVERLAALGSLAGTTVTASVTDAGAASLLVADASAIGTNHLVRVRPPAGGPYYHVVPAAPGVLTPSLFTVLPVLKSSHAASSLLAQRMPMLEVRAIDAGQWGNRLRVAMERMDPLAYTPLLTTTVREVLPGSRLRLWSAAGVETGTELQLTDAANTAFNVKVSSIDRQDDFLITLEGSTPLPGSIAVGDAVRSVEYRFVVELLRQPDPANPQRNSVAIDREVFSGLSLDFRHSRYFQRVIGATWTLTSNLTVLDDADRPLRRSDRRSEGESAYVRVHDLATKVTGLRVGPQADYERRPDGSLRLILLPLSHGDDALTAFMPDERIYIGTDAPEPELRTGLQTLRNVEEISIVAAPGRTSTALQGALITHCELMRYRFAVLDALAPPADTLAGVQNQRQQFDTKYAALYHPWLLIPDPYPLTNAARADVPIPPSGHMVGIYARTDIERGVHKAPANEVVRGITGLQRVLNKEQHDILNPYPVNIDVIRDFRSNNRGIRVYGGRCITSDPDWKYVNVRRLLIFIEASIDRGLQWVVFEPNAEPLWARVRRSISNFLTLVWRNGALEGTKPEEAFFVKCDRTTMTQTDIDQGRLICLVGVAPVKPAEFVIVRIGLWTAHAED